MRFIVYLITLLFVGTAVAQNPTILQGNYITNVFGQSNFVLNPNAQTNVANVTNATRSTTTPLVATSEFNLSLTSGTNATWTLRTFDAGMKNQNCEARFTYRGFASGTSKAELVQNSLVVASLTLTPSASDPRIASINFPCGDLTYATTFRIAQTTANMTPTNEIGGIYVGLATNMANVAQAETVVIASRNVLQSIPNGTPTIIEFNVESKDVYGEYNNSTGVFTAKRAGTYYVSAISLTGYYAWIAGNTHELRIFKNSSVVATDRRPVEANITQFMMNTIFASVDLVVGDTLTVKFTHDRGSATDIFSDPQYTNMQISRFPSSSELVVTPERQNVWGGVVYTNQNQSLFGGSASGSTRSYFNNSTWNQPTLLKGKAAISTTNSGNALGFSIPNLPVGRYKVEVSGLINANNNGSTSANVSVICNWYIKETTTGADVARQSNQDWSVTTAGNEETRDYGTSFSGVFDNTSIGTRDFILEAMKMGDLTTGSNGVCQAFSNTAAGAALNTNITFLLTPLDQPSNSALYVQGPVKAAGTGTDVTSDYQGYIPGTLRSATKGKTYSARSSTSVTTSESISVSLTLNPGIYWCSANSTISTSVSNTWYSDFAVDGTKLTDASYSSAVTTTTLWTNKTLTIPVIISQSADLQLRQSLGAGTASGYYHEMWCLKIN